MGKKAGALSEPLALFGGTFDPVHYGHLRAAEAARQKLALKNLTLLPAGTPAHRAAPQATADQRLEMLRLAQSEFPHLLIDDREVRRAGPSYMIDTLKELRAEYPQRPLLLLVGQDAFNHLDSWYQWESLFALAHLVILTRPDTKPQYRQELAKQVRQRLVSDGRELFSSIAGGIMPLDVEPVDVSATSIKARINEGHSPGPMLPMVVLDYIIKNRLYLTA